MWRKARLRGKPTLCSLLMRALRSAWLRPRGSPARWRHLRRCPSLAVWAACPIPARVARGPVSEDEEKKLCAALLEAPRHIAEFLKQEATVKALGEEIAKATDVLYMGRGQSFPLALE